MSKLSPDHSPFSRFKSRLSKNAVDQLNFEVLCQFVIQGFNINEGIAVDARLVKSSSRPLSNDQLRKVIEHCNSFEVKLDKNVITRKFSRYIESDWVLQNDKSHYGLNEHATVDTNHGFILIRAMPVDPIAIIKRAKQKNLKSQVYRLTILRHQSLA